ncbi:DUF1064 domain-containing protein [Comamonas thiooxydans]|uniref:DUF1064 domain-containing protein n=1 Tax=Comamonas thiooxydans TaxID=363952 RepID=A0AA42Q4C1_9BURK|nr:DUF1064 domain-containing protein [Comamonas thiooxydans]MDH1336807.1 DUF1064 domain-containing protein [Comamonas thiooxydans]MDH1742929.1 DUF1064 domain-containing protein [Comamonas thiooxydans]MDH1789271.1 DUF1064 domain-containing protein [Comamonas thiooxydans]
MNAKRFTNALPRSQGPSGAAGNDAGMVALLKAQGYGVGRGIRDTWSRAVAGNAGSGAGRAQAPAVQAAGKRSGAGGAKYGNKKTVTPDGVKFDSRAEARRWGHLCMQLRAGEISELRRQVAYELVPAVKYSDASRVKKAIRYVADFVYVEKGVEVIEDVKGVLTPEFKLKRHLMKALLGLEVRLVK